MSFRHAAEMFPGGENPQWNDHKFRPIWFSLVNEVLEEYNH